LAAARITESLFPTTNQISLDLSCASTVLSQCHDCLGTLFGILDAVGGEKQWESGLEVADEVGNVTTT